MAEVGGAKGDGGKREVGDGGDHEGDEGEGG